MQVVLIQRGGCSFHVKAQRAQKAGAIGLIMCNNNQDEPDEMLQAAAEGYSPVAASESCLQFAAPFVQTVRVQDRHKRHRHPDQLCCDICHRATR